jgi:hypothetical protein
MKQLVQDQETPPKRMELNVSQPRATQVYCETIGLIDQHNRDRQVTLGIEKKLVTHDWAKRVNITILSMCLVDAWKVWSNITVNNSGKPTEAPKAFYGHLAAELIDNNYNGGRVE